MRSVTSEELNGSIVPEKPAGAMVRGSDGPDLTRSERPFSQGHLQGESADSGADALEAYRSAGRHRRGCSISCRR